MILASSRRFSFYYYYYRLRNLLTVFFFVSCDVLAISRLLSVVYIRRRDFIHSESAVQRKIAECSKKALFCGDCCDKN